MTATGRWTTVIVALGLTVAIGFASGASVVSGKVEEEDVGSVRDILTSIEAKLASLVDSGHQRGSSCVGQRIAERMDAFEAKLSRIEAKLEEHLSKIREGEITKEVLKEPTASELAKKMDSTAEKLFARLGIFEAKSGIQMASVGVKIQRMERHLGRSMDDTLDKILKIEEKNTQMMESLWTLHVNQDDTGHRRDDPVKFRARSAEVQLDDQWAADLPAGSAGPCPLLLQNLTDTLTEATLVNRKKIDELDGDVEIYTRKVLNAFRELSVEYKGLESNSNKVLAQGNHTHELIREGFRRIVQQMKPITAFDDILQSLHKKVLEFENTIDASFASLLVAQNMFIGLLQRLVTKMDEKSSLPAVPLHSSSDILWTALESHRKDVGRALHDLVWTVIKVGNETMDEMARTFGQLTQGQCPCVGSTVAPVLRATEDGLTEAPSAGKDSYVSSTASSYEEEKHDEPIEANPPIK